MERLNIGLIGLRGLLVNKYYKYRKNKEKSPFPLIIKYKKEEKTPFHIITEHKTLWTIALVVLTAIWVVSFDIYFKNYGLVSQAMPMDTKEFFVIYLVRNHILFTIPILLIIFQYFILIIFNSKIN